MRKVHAEHQVLYKAQKMETKGRILVVDDHPIVVSGIRAMLSHHTDITITAVNSGERAIDDYPHVNPDVVVLDINLPGQSGFETARLAR